MFSKLLRVAITTLRVTRASSGIFFNNISLTQHTHTQHTHTTHKIRLHFKKKMQMYLIRSRTTTLTHFNFFSQVLLGEARLSFEAFLEEAEVVGIEAQLGPRVLE